MASSHCGLLVIDPWDIAIECCLHLNQPIRLNEDVVFEATVSNEEEVGVKGTLVFEVVDTETGDMITEIDRQGFNLESGESGEYEVTFTPEGAGLTDYVQAHMGDECPHDQLNVGTRVYTTDEESLGDEIRGA